MNYALCWKWIFCLGKKKKKDREREIGQCLSEPMTVWREIFPLGPQSQVLAIQGPMDHQELLTF